MRILVSLEFNIVLLQNKKTVRFSGTESRVSDHRSSCYVCSSCIPAAGFEAAAGYSKAEMEEQQMIPAWDEPAEAAAAADEAGEDGGRESDDEGPVEVQMDTEAPLPSR
jgi:hypothetical protein